MKNTGFVKPLSEAYFVKTAFWEEICQGGFNPKTQFMFALQNFP